MSYYSVIRFCPKPEIGEAMNMGVVVYDDDSALVRFVDDWGRLSRFSGSDALFLKDVARDFEKRCGLEAGAEDRLTKSLMEKISQRWIHAVQVSEPAGSILPLERLLDQMAGVFLPPVIEKPKKARDRRAAQGIAVRMLKDAVARVSGRLDAADQIKKDQVIVGAITSHRFDVSLENGLPRMVGLAYSFEGRDDNDRMMNSVRAGYLAVKEAREAYPFVDVAAIVLEPKAPAAKVSYDESRKSFDKLGVRIVPEKEIPSWAGEVATKYADVLHG